jgi:hypothetical protein
VRDYLYRSDGNIPIECLPLHPKESVSRITLNSAELGLYQYDLKMIAVPAGPERILNFKVCLGNQQTQTFRFLSYSKQKTEYTCKLDSTEFTVEKTVSVPAGSIKLIQQLQVQLKLQLTLLTSLPNWETLELSYW